MFKTIRKQLHSLYKEINKLSSYQYIYIIFSVLILSFVILLISLKLLLGDIQSLSKWSIKYAGEIRPNLSKAYEFNYRKAGSYNISIKPQWEPKSAISIWVYQPDKTVRVFDFAKLNSEKAIVFEKAIEGTYRVSIRNEGSSKIDYSLEITLNKASATSLR